MTKKKTPECHLKDITILKQEQRTKMGKKEKNVRKYVPLDNDRHWKLK